MNHPAPLHERVRAALTTAFVCLAVLSPMVPDANGKRHDDYPLSWYPMFRGIRPAQERMVWVRASLEDGSTRPVASRYWTPGGLSEGRSHLERAIEEGKTEKFCDRLAKSLADRTKGWASETTSVEIVRGTFVLSSWFGGGEAKAEKERILQRCDVPR